MEINKFEELWVNWSSQWLQEKVASKSISNLCKVRENAMCEVYTNYGLIKNLIKDNFFKTPQAHPMLNRYKRAAVIAYAVLKSNPLEIFEMPMQEDMYFLKQRLAFFIAIGSILQDFDQEQVRSKRIFAIFKEIGKRDLQEGNDDFLTSVYKDMFYSELYNNYNVFTMANVFGLLIEEAAGFSELETLDHVADNEG